MVRGKKSMFSLASFLATAVARTIVSPYLTITEPSACFAKRPVSSIRDLSLTSSSTLVIQMSLPDPDLFDEFFVSALVAFFEICQEPASLPDEYQKTSS